MSGDLLQLVDHIERALKAKDADLGPVDHSSEGWTRRREATARMGEQLTASIGMRINDKWDGCRVSLAGISSTSTTGLVGALHNWMAAARRRAA